MSEMKVIVGIPPIYTVVWINDMTENLHVGGVVAIGFDKNNNYMIVVSHSGLGVYDTNGWSLCARNSDLAYPENGYVTGIGPIDGTRIKVVEKNYDNDSLTLSSPDGCWEIKYEDGTIIIESTQQSDSKSGAGQAGPADR